MTEETKDRIAEWVLYVFYGALALLLLGAIIVGLIVNPISVLFFVGILGAAVLVGWSVARLNR